MNFDEFMARMLSAFPEAVVDEDNDGQLIIYTGLRVDPGTQGEPVWSVVPFESE